MPFLRTKAGGGLIVLLLCLTALAVLGSLPGMPGRARVDWTRDGLYTLSPASIRIVRELPKPVTIQMVLSKHLPAEFQVRRNALNDWLIELEANAGGKVRLATLNPDDDDEARSKAQGLGIRPVTLRSETREGLEVQRGWFAIAFSYGDRTASLPIPQDLSDFEYEIMTTIKRLTGEGRRVGVLEGAEGFRYSVQRPGDGEPTVGFARNFQTLHDEMSRQFESVESVDRVPGQASRELIDSALDLLVVAAPLQLDEADKFRIDQFLMQGKSVIFLTPGMDVRMTGEFSATPSANGYEDLLAFYGMAVAKNLVAQPHDWERIHGAAPGTERPYPYWVRLQHGAFSPDNPVTSRLQTLSFPWASSVEWGIGGQGTTTAEVLVRTTPDAWEEQGVFSIAPRNLSEYMPGPPRAFPLAVLRSGPLTSFFSEHLPTGFSAEQDSSIRKNSVGEPRILVIGNALFATDFYVGHTGATGNLTFLLNAMNHLVLDPDMIQIRNRRIHEAPLDTEASTRWKTHLILLNMLLVPLLLVGIGLILGRGDRRNIAFRFGFTRKTDARTSTWFITATLVLALSAAGILAGVFWRERVDLTRDREYSLAPATLQTLNQLPDKVVVRVAMSKDLPVEFSRIRSRLTDLLHEFEARSGGRLQVVLENPERDSASRLAALSLGMEEVVFREQSREGIKARKGFFGLAVLYRDEKEVFPLLQSAETFEYDLVVRLRRLTGLRKTVGIVEGSAGNRFQILPPEGEAVPAAAFGANFGMLARRLDASYALEPQSPADSAIGQRVDALLVAAPTRLTRGEATRIGEFIRSGKPVLFLYPGMHIDLSTGIDAAPIAPDTGAAGLPQLLAHYGIQVRPDLLMDPSHAEAVRFGDDDRAIPYPFWIRATGPALAAENPVTHSLPWVGLPWVSSLRIDPGAQPKATREVLISTSPKAWAESASTVQANSLYPDALDSYRPRDLRKYPIAVLLSGPMTEFNGIVTASTNQTDAVYHPGRILVVSNALFVSDFYAGYADIEPNLQFILNALDFMTLDTALISMRSRPLPDRPLNADKSKRLKPMLIGLNMVLLPILVLAVWGLIALRRKAIRRERR